MLDINAEPVEVVQREEWIATDDGWRLAANVYTSSSNPRAVLIINSATAVHRRFYEKFATYAAHFGFTAYTYDYRGIGDSIATARAPEATMYDWAIGDFPAVLRWVRARYPSCPIVGIGHSVGGQLFALSRESVHLSALIGVGAQSGYWRHWPRGWGKWVWWNVHVPLLTRIFGHLPAWAGIGTSLPKGVALQWARWCRSPEYFVDHAGESLPTYFASLTLPKLWVSVEGDPFGPLRAIQWMIDRLPAPIEHRVLSGRDRHGLPIGHFGPFRPVCEPVWDEMLDWVDKHLHTP
jgi:predicted alpha/beta hydrolase